MAVFVRGGIAEIARGRLERRRDLAIAATIRAVAHRAPIASKKGLALCHRAFGIVAFASAAGRQSSQRPAQYRGLNRGFAVQN